MDRFINLNLFTVPNVIAIGAIVFFWGCAAYALHSNLSGADAA